MVRDYRRTKSRLARRQSKVFMRQTFFLILVAISLLFVVIQFGVPLIIRVAVFLSDARSGNQITQTEEAAVLVAPTLQTLPEATFSARLDIAGFAQEGVLVTVFLNGTPQDEVEVDSEGEFILRNLKLRAGRNRIWAVSQDKSGNESPESTEMVVMADSQGPKITLDSPGDGEEVSEASITITGTVDEDVSLTINGQFVLQQADGSFTKTVVLTEGENTLLIEATDRAGNRALKEVRVIYSP